MRLIATRTHTIKPKELLRKVKRKSIISLYRAIRPRSNLVAEMPWDNLIVLDGCRFDAFVQVNNLPGKLTKIVSAASCTSEWLSNNFSGRNIKDVVYISANPYISYYYVNETLGNVPFYKIVEVWKDGWDDGLQTVHPSAVNQATQESLYFLPQKRHLIHYLQPHHPFIGDVKLIDAEAIPGLREKVLGKTRVMKRKPDIFVLLERKAVDVHTVWRAYISNLQLVLSYINKLLPALTGRVCLTSDHGDAFGRFGIFGHPARTPIPELIEVPWLEVSS